LIDTDGDKLTDYEEMILWRDPFVEGPLPHDPTPEEIEEAERAVVAAKAAALEEAERLWPERSAKLAEHFQPSFEAGKEAADPDFVRNDNEAVRARLIARRDKAAADQAKTKAELDRIAAKHGVERFDEKGTLVGESEQGPIFMSPQDALAADSISADDLWPAGLHTWQNTSLSRNLTGAGIRASIWEANASDGTAGIRTTHGEFNGARAIQVDGGAASNHGTAVANVIVGGGILDVFRGSTNYGKLLRGVAYQGELDGYNLDLFTAETSTTVLNGQNFSNHSYGVNGGWSTIVVSGTTWWYWVLPAFTEDPRLGLYSPTATAGNSSADLDQFVATAETHLPVYASGNPNGGGPGNPVSPATTISHRIPSGGGTVVSTVVRDWINGDSGYDTVLSPGTAKNVLTVGSITDINGGSFGISGFTGTGPTDDGRIKPDLVAEGQRNEDLAIGKSLFAATKASTGSYYNGLIADSEGATNLAGTSFAAPAVAGGLMLAEQRRRQLLPAAGPLLASTWKAGAIHGALDYGNPGPDYLTGYGIFDAVRLVEILEEDFALGRGTLIKEFTIATGAAKTFYVTLPANTVGELTLAWSDPAGTPPPFASVLDDPTPMLKNNLDVVVQDTVTSTNHLPWILAPDLPAPGYAGGSPIIRGAAAIRGADNRNNVEKITIDASSQPRRLLVTVTPNGTLVSGSQKTSLILSGVVPEAPVVTSSGFAQNPSNLDEFGITFSSDPGAFFTLESSTTLEGGSWSNVSTVKAEASATTVLTSRNPTEPRRFWRIRRGQ
jgi:Subtilase family